LEGAISRETDPSRQKALQSLLQNVQNGQIQNNFQSNLDAIGNLHPLKLAEIPIPQGLKSASEILKKVPGSFQVISDRATGMALKAYKFAPDEERQHIVDQAVIKAAAGLDPEKLTRQQDALISNAYMREAAKAENRQAEAEKREQRLNDILDRLDQSIQNGAIVRILDDTHGRVSVTRRPTAADTAARYAR
jgi:hypothetical protein